MRTRVSISNPTPTKKMVGHPHNGSQMDAQTKAERSQKPVAPPNSAVRHFGSPKNHPWLGGSVDTLTRQRPLFQQVLETPQMGLSQKHRVTEHIPPSAAVGLESALKLARHLQWWIPPNREIQGTLGKTSLTVDG